jgi:hypothetical protein
MAEGGRLDAGGRAPHEMLNLEWCDGFWVIDESQMSNSLMWRARLMTLFREGGMLTSGGIGVVASGRKEWFK